MSTVGGPRLSTISKFTNTYSLDFDGVDDYLNLGNGVSFEYTDSFSYSFWLKPNAVSGTKNLYTKYDAGRGIYTYLNSASGAGSNNLYFLLFNTNIGSTATRKRINTSTGAIIPPNVWTNIVITYDGSGLGSGINVYKNGVPQTVTVTQDNLQNSTIVNTVDSYLCAFNGISSFFPGGQDEFAIFNTELSEDNALSIYNGGVPTDLTSLSPVAWYRMGDNGSWKSPQWLLPNNENKDKVSNYSFDFDGVDDYVDTGITTTGTNNITISCWIKTTETFGYLESRCAFGGYNNGSGANYTLGRMGSAFSSPDDMKVRVFNTLGTTKLNDGNWHNIIYTYDYSTKEVKAYVDGNTTPEATATFPAFNSNYIIAIGWNGVNSSYHFEGNVDECAVWYSILGASDITAIYNSGAPSDLTSLSPVSWYRNGEEATFSGGVWTVPDAIGSNNGTSNAMTIEDRVGDAPNSENNALSYNMDEVDRVEDTP